MRNDGRQTDELRHIRLERGYTQNAAGSVLASFGDTKVICTASFDERVPFWLRGQGRGWVTAEYAMLPGAAQERVSRDAVRKGRAMEISRLIGRSLRAVVDLDAMGECLVTVDCDVIQADGGTRTAAITGAFVALHDGLSASVAAGHLPSLPIRSGCAAVSVGVVDGVPMLDLCYEEDVRADVDMNFVMNGEAEYIEVQGCAEKESFPRKTMTAMMDLGEAGIKTLITAQREALNLG